MRRIGRRLALPVIIATLALGPMAQSAAAWDATCNSGEACVWIHANFIVPLAAQSASDKVYGDNVYPNTTYSLSNSVSSIRNRKASNIVIWYGDNNWSGASFCLNPGWESGQLNSHNDQYDSHLVGAPSSC